ncbi:nodulin MtN21 /EamA-like transporter family protein [Striga asiatica]|uniref:Nodulin MtN21 /EamA-like transporter family protein n=1 Tax=Striga asiatica TaxID=4170 RepID=A0A5A7Q4E2_STRAF|nr:nodulin MtN21 /EamA-like transporter family protein [Striga asiatica]
MYRQHAGGPTSIGSASHRHPTSILRPATTPLTSTSSDGFRFLRQPRAHPPEKTTVSSRLPASIDRRLHRSPPSLAGVPSIGAPTAADYPFFVTCSFNLMPEFCCATTMNPPPATTPLVSVLTGFHRLQRQPRQSSSSSLRPLHSTSTRPTAPNRLQRHGRNHQNHLLHLIKFPSLFYI